MSPKKARIELAERGIKYNKDVFIEKTKEGDSLVVDLFLLAGMNPDERSADGTPALIFASALGHKPIINLLLDRGADINAVSYDYQRAITAAARIGNTEIVELLIEKGAEVKIIGWDDPVEAAVSHGHTKTLKALLDNGANSNGEWGAISPLMLCSSRGYKDCVELLLNSGAEKDRQETEGRTAVGYAVLGGHLEILRLLVDSGADVNIGDPILSASTKGETELVIVLLNAGANPNSEKQGRTALMEAARIGNTKIVEALLEFGADKNARTKRGITAQDIAYINKHYDIVRLIDDF